MASVQAPPAVQHPGAPMPAGMTKQQAEEVFRKLKQMKDQGVSQSDPEFIKASQFLINFQQQQHMRRSQQQYLQQQQQLQLQQQQQQQQMQNATNGVSTNGVQPVRPQQATPQATQPPSNALSASAMPTQNTSTPASAGTSPSTASTPNHFTQQQLGLLRQQIHAFKLLGKNAGVSAQLQQAIFNQRQRRQAAVADAPQGAHPVKPSQPGPDAGKASQDGPEPDTQDESSQAPKAHTFKTVKSPYGTSMIRSSIKYFDHSQRKNRWFIPGVFPTGIDFDHLRYEREVVVSNRMRQRYAELKNLPGDLAHWDSSKENLEADDTLKRKAIIEMKSIALYAKQRALRDKIGRQMMHYDNLAMTTNRSNYRRMKKQNVREARITEKLEKQQRDARENREKKKHSDFLRAIFSHQQEVTESAASQRTKSHKLARLMYQQHFNIEKEEQKRIERNAKQRLQALKADDEEAYLKLLDQAKDTRITHLLRQTDGFLNQLASSVKAQQRQAAERYGDEIEPAMEEESDYDEEGESNKKIDYYAVAHRIREEVTEQANILVGGKLKEYQVKGLQWMISLYNNNLNGILADEMGLGKTIQTISLITYLIERKQQPGPYLVIVPLSTLTNWNLEFERWAPSVSRIVYKGPPNARKQQQDKIRQGKFQVLLTTYEYIIKDRPVLSKIKWFHMIIDEGHRMKNSNSKLSAQMKTQALFLIALLCSSAFAAITVGTPAAITYGDNSFAIGLDTNECGFQRTLDLTGTPVVEDFIWSVSAGGSGCVPNAFLLVGSYLWAVLTTDNTQNLISTTTTRSGTVTEFSTYRDPVETGTVFVLRPDANIALSSTAMGANFGKITQGYIVGTKDAAGAWKGLTVNSVSAFRHYIILNVDTTAGNALTDETGARTSIDGSGVQLAINTRTGKFTAYANGADVNQAIEDIPEEEQEEENSASLLSIAALAALGVIAI